MKSAGGLRLSPTNVDRMLQIENIHLALCRYVRCALHFSHPASFRVSRHWHFVGQPEGGDVTTVLRGQVDDIEVFNANQLGG